MTEQQGPTVRERALAAEISPDALDGHFQRGALRLDGQPVADLDQPAPSGSRIVVAGTPGSWAAGQ